MKQKLKERLDMFSDAIIAILITIMVLELPIEVHRGVVDYGNMFTSIGIYLVSFCFIANLWYQHAIIFNEAKAVPNQIVVYDLIFLFLMSLIPTFTRLMTTDINAINVIMYGFLCLIITLLFRLIAKTILHEKYTDKKDMAQVYEVIYGDGHMTNGVGYIILMIIGYFAPTVALVMLIIIPIRSFISHVQEFEEITDIQKMDQVGQQEFLKMSDSDKRKFRHMVRRYMKQERRSGHDRNLQRDSWKSFSDQTQKLFNIDDETLMKWFK